MNKTMTLKQVRSEIEEWIAADYLWSEDCERYVEAIDAHFAAQREDKKVTDETLNAALTARWKVINPHIDWVPKWSKGDRAGMRAAIEAALSEKGQSK